MTATYPRRRLFRWAAVLLLVQGVLMETLAFVGLLVLLVLGVSQESLSAQAQIFALPYLQDNVYMMMAMSGIFAAIRITGAIALWRGRMWGLALSAIFCVVTLAQMVFLMPAGLADGILSGGALAFMLCGWFGGRSIEDARSQHTSA